MERVVGGQVTTPNDQPWMAGLWYQGKFYCGATVISRKHLLTAAHCTYTFDHREIRVYLGGHDIAKDFTEIRRIKSVEEHEYYDGVSFNNDIALIELDKPIKFGPKVQPACLPDGGKYSEPFQCKYHHSVNLLEEEISRHLSIFCKQ